MDFNTLFNYRFGPRVHTEETGKGILVQIALPGCTKEDVELKFRQKDDAIILRAQDAFLNEKVERVYRLNESYDVSKTKAQISEGILTLTIPYIEDGHINNIPIE